MSRAAIIAAARGWIGTPYVHQASCKGAGTDCLGLLRGVWREVMGAEPEIPPTYSPDWAERQGAETLLEALSRHMVPVAVNAARPGDVLVFRMREGAPAKHCAILSGPSAILHAWQGRAVAETPYTPYWQRRCVAAGAFPFPT